MKMPQPGFWRKIYTLLGHDEVLKICKEKLQVNPDSPSANFAMFEVMKLNGAVQQGLGLY